MKHKLIILAALAVQLFTYGARIEDFPWVRNLAPAEGVRAVAGELGMVQLDATIYRDTGDLRQSLRIFDAGQREIPFLLIKKQAQTVSQVRRFRPVATRFTAWQQRADGSALLRFETTKAPDRPLVRIELDTAAKDFDKKIRLYAVDADGKRTQLLADAFYDCSSKVALTQRSFDFFETTARRFELEIENYTEYVDSPVRQLVSGSENYSKSTQLRRELKLDKVTLFDEDVLTNEPVLEPVSLEWKTKELEHKTQIEFAASKMPLISITLAVNEANFARSYDLYDGEGRKLAAGKLKRITENGVCKVDDVTIELAGQRPERYLLDIINDDNPPLSITRLSAQSEVWSLLFFIPPAEQMPLRCGYGAPAGVPGFDIGEVVQYTPGEHYTPFVWGETLHQAAPSGPRDYRWLYYLVMAVVATVTIVVVFWGIKKVNRLEP